MALSNQEISMIRKSWEPVEWCIAKWPRLFIILFADDPQMKKTFKSFDNISNDQLLSDKRFKARAGHVVSLISGFVISLNDEETVFQMIEDMAERYSDKKITIPMFETMGAVLIKWLKESSGEAMDEKTDAAWKKLFASLVSTLKAKYSDPNKSSS